MCWIHFHNIFSSHGLIDLVQNSLRLSTHIFFGFRLDSFKMKSTNCNTFLSFKVITHAYLLRVSIKHSKNRILSLKFLMNCISARSAPQILSLKSECTFLSLNLLITGLYSPSANSKGRCFLKYSHFWHHYQKLLYQKIYRPLKQVRVDVRHISKFFQY